LALIGSFKKLTYSGRGRHPGRVECGYSTFDAKGQRFLQLDTYGSGEREFPGKTSQTIQVDRVGARELKRILEQAFPGI
jgi:hypothetical protein